MSQVTHDAVEKLKEWLRLPVDEDDSERAAKKNDIESLSAQFGSLVFGDERWYDYTADQIAYFLQAQGQEWLDDRQVAELEALTQRNDLDSFLTWLESELPRLQAGAAGRGIGQAPAEEAAGQAQAFANPNYATDQVPGTQFYKYDPAQGYLYADSESASDWRSLEDRVSASRQPQEPSHAEGAQRGYPNPQATIPGTRYYILQDGTYLYNDTEHGDDGHGWQPYEYWQQFQQPAQPAEPQPAEPQQGEPQPAAATLEAAVEEAATTAFANLDVDALAGLDLSADDIDQIADAIAAQIASGMEG